MKERTEGCLVVRFQLIQAFQDTSVTIDIFAVNNHFHEQDDARLLQGCACKSSWHKDVMGACARSKMTSSQKLGKANIVILGSVSFSSLCLYLSLSVSLSVSLCLSLHLPVSLSVSVSLCQSLCFYIWKH